MSQSKTGWNKPVELCYAVQRWTKQFKKDYGQSGKTYWSNFTVCTTVTVMLCYMLDTVCWFLYWFRRIQHTSGKYKNGLSLACGNHVWHSEQKEAEWRHFVLLSEMRCFMWFLKQLGLHSVELHKLTADCSRSLWTWTMKMCPWVWADSLVFKKFLHIFSEDYFFILE